MKSITKYLAILLLLSVALPVIVFAGSSNVTATSASPTPTPTTTPTFTSFFNCVFGVRIFPGADPMGSYTVNVPETGSVSGKYTQQLFEGSGYRSIVVYLSKTNNMWDTSDHGILGTLRMVNMPFGSYIATTDADGNYAINNVPLGHYYVYRATSLNNANAGNGIFVQSVDLTASAPNAVVNITIIPGNLSIAIISFAGYSLPP